MGNQEVSGDRFPVGHTGLGKGSTGAIHRRIRQ